MFAPSRDQARRFFFDTWAKSRRGESLSGLEQTVLEVMLLHPEYHAILEQPDRHADRDYCLKRAISIHFCICPCTSRWPNNCLSTSPPGSPSATGAWSGIPARSTLRCTR